VSRGGFELPEALEDGILIWQPDGVVLYANEAAGRIFQASPEQMIGAASDTSQLLAADGEPVAPEQLPAARVKRTGKLVEQELASPRPDGGYVWYTMRSAPLPDGVIASTFSVISQLEARARASARIATVVEASPDLIWIFNARGQIE
jgi:PAS domain S-box-containing protein